MSSLPPAEDILRASRQPQPLSDFNEELTSMDPAVGAPAGQRAAFSILPPEGRSSGYKARLAYLQGIYGPGNVDQMHSGEWVVRDKSGWHQFDEKNKTLTDIADMAGPAIEIVPSVAGSMAGSPVLGGAAGQVAGRAMKQMAADAIIGGSSQPTGERLGDLAGAGGEALILGGAANGAQGVANAFRPGAKIARAAINEMSVPPPPESLLARARRVANGQSPPETPLNPIAQQGVDLEKELGTGMTLGQQTQSPTLLKVEGLARRGDQAGDIMQKADWNRQRLFTGALDNFVEGLAKGETKQGAGEMLASAYESRLKGLVQARREEASKAYDAAFGLMPRGREGAEAFSTKSTRRAATIIRNQLDAPAGPQAVAGGEGALADRITAYLDALPETMNPKQMQRSMSLWKEELAGTGNLTRDLPPTQRKRVAAEILAGLRRDFEKAETNGSVPKGSVAALDNADRVYAQMSQPIEEAKNLAIGKMIGQDAAPEAIVERFNRLQPSQIEQVMTFVDKADPEVAATVRRAIIEDALAPAKDTIIGGSEVYRPGGLAALDKPGAAARIAAVLPQKDRGVLLKLMEVGRRTRNLPLAGSPTGPYLESSQALQENMSGLLSKESMIGGGLGAAATVGGGAVTGAGAVATGGASVPAIVAGAMLGKGAKGIADWFARRNTREIARIVSSPDGMDALRELARPDVKVGRVARILEGLGQIAARDNGIDPPSMMQKAASQ